MLFPSPEFLFFFLPLVLAGILILKGRARNIFLLLASLFFYAWGEMSYVFVMLASIGANYGLGLAIGEAGDPARAGARKWWLAAAVAVNLGLLGWFKYANFLADNLNAVLAWMGAEPVPLGQVHLPIGISFFTFQAMSYVIDVYRGVVPPGRRFDDIALYISLFPQLIAGPIVRYRDIAAEIAGRKVNLDGFSLGVKIFVIGLAKKMLLANPMGEMADQIIALGPQHWTQPLAWLGIGAYTLQIYFDFSGYSDMAIGLGRMLGFTFPINFHYPYISRSITEFWRRWHISLSTWFRDYLYIPLGGNRVSPARLYFNLWVVFLLCGLWHGASWNFVIWGSIHGIFLVIERAGLLRLLQSRFMAPLAHVYAMFVVVCAWVFFRIEEFPVALDFLGAMFGLGEGSGRYSTAYYLSPDKQFVLVMALAACLPWSRWLMIARLRLDRWETAWGHRLHWVLGSGELAGQAAILLLSLMQVAAGTYNPFIYFRF